MTRKDYAFRGQFNEKPSIVPGCSEPRPKNIAHRCKVYRWDFHDAKPSQDLYSLAKVVLVDEHPHLHANACRRAPTLTCHF